MKRLNPSTSLPFKQGHIREDGFLFWGYKKSKKNSKGFFVEDWSSPKAFQNAKNKILKYYLENKETVNFRSKNWHKNNPEKVKTKAKKYRQNNLAKDCAKTIQRDLAKINRTPSWLTKDHLKQIQTLYIRSSLIKLHTGEFWHVDHIVPLRGKTVSGLHVPWNLQLLPATENILKSNKF